MEEINLDSKKKTKFNMMAATLERLDTSLIKAMANYRKGNIRGWYFELKGLKMQIVSKLNKEEREQLKSIEIVIERKFGKPITIPLAVESIEDYNERLQDIMEDKGLTIVDKEDETIFT